MMAAPWRHLYALSPSPALAPRRRPPTSHPNVANMAKVGASVGAFTDLQKGRGNRRSVAPARTGWEPEGTQQLRYDRVGDRRKALRVSQGHIDKMIGPDVDPTR